MRLVRSGQGGVQRELRRLANAHVISRTVRGRTAFYQANRGCPVFDELHGLVIKTAGVAEVLHTALIPIEERIELAFVYGSAARARLRVASDIDLFVIGSIGFGEVVDALSNAQARLGREVNPSVFDPLEFERRIALNDDVVATVVSV